jgi:zinc protease
MSAPGFARARTRALRRYGLLAAALASAFACKPARPAVSAGAASESASESHAARLLVQPGTGPVLELRFVIEGGSKDDPRGREGLSHVMLTSMLEGRAGEVSYPERARRLYPMAAALSGYVGREQTVLVARVHRDHAAAFYPLLRGVLLAPAFDAADVERVRTRALSSLTQDLRGADDEELGKQTLQAMLYEGASREHPELGTESGLTAIRAADVSAHWARLLCARRMSVALSGPLPDGLLQVLRGDLATLDRSACTAPEALAAPPARPGRRVWIVDKPEAQSVAISIGVAIEATRNHPDHAALTLAAAYLGQHRTFAGRLMQAMREQRGLNYGDYAYAEHFEQDGDSRFPLPNVARREQYFSIWVRPVRVEQAHFALRAALYELGRFLEEGLSEADFSRIQTFAQRYYALYAQTEQQRLGYTLDDAFYAREAPYLEQLRAAFAALTREQLRAAVARQLALDRLQIAIVAPHAARLAEALVEDAPSPITYVSDKPELREEDKRIAAHALRLTAEQIRIVPVAEIFN